MGTEKREAMVGGGCYIHGLPDEIVLHAIIPKLIAAWDLRLLMLKQVNRTWRSQLCSVRGLLGPFRKEIHIDQVAFGVDCFSRLEAYDPQCKAWRQVKCKSIATRIASQVDGLKIYAIHGAGIHVLNLTISDEQGRPETLLGDCHLQWKRLAGLDTLKFVSENHRPSKFVATIQGRFVLGECKSGFDENFVCFHVLDIEKDEWGKIMVSALGCITLKHPERGCLLALDYKTMELFVYDVITLQETKRSFAIHVEGGKMINLKKIFETGDGRRVFAQGQGEDENLLAFASLDVLLDEGELRFDEFVEQVNFPKGSFSSLRNDHARGCHAIVEVCDEISSSSWLWKGNYIETSCDGSKKLVWEGGVELKDRMHYISTLM